MPRLCWKRAARNGGAGNQEDTVPEPEVSLQKRKIGEPDRYQSRPGVKLNDRHTREGRI